MLRKQQGEPDGPKYGRIGSSEPYLESDAIYDMPDAVPQVIRDLIQAQQGEARKAAEEAELKLTCPDMLDASDEEMAWRSRPDDFPSKKKHRLKTRDSCLSCSVA